ncbi:hypothetical protein FZX09_04055 [Synechococcus sp. MU1643]|uniref:tyrosine-type recombinase/integrase n=1 Tax=Synechococcus sp. MU1643 TaxID=2508349 RepID=UPI001CF84E4E|nr:hypothetical protein [Synechococcus sp. MU1643]MCB4427986.1 hypothetical protein [Synechococcus sp. MU1643]
MYRSNNGKTYRESLQTRDHAKALRLWPAAYQRLKDKANGIKGAFIPTTQIGYELDPATGKEREVTGEDLFGPGELEEVMTWQQAAAIHNERIGDKRGRPMTAKTKASSQALAIKPISHVAPALVTVADVQRYVRTLKDQGLAASTISQRHGMCRAIAQSLMKQGYLTANVWDRVEVSAAPGEPHPTPTPEECRLIWDTGNWWLRVLLYTGLRENELCQRKQAHLDGRWLRIDRSHGCQVKNPDSIREVLLPEWAGTDLPKQPGRTTLYKLVKRITPRITLHSLRSGTRTALAQAGVTTEVSERILGHRVGKAVGASYVRNYAEYTREIIGPAMEKGWEVLDTWTGREN